MSEIIDPTDDRKIIDPHHEQIMEAAKVAKVLKKKYPDLKIMLLGGSAYIGEEGPGSPGEGCVLHNVAFLFEAPVQGSALNPQGQHHVQMGMHIKPPAGSQAGLIGTLRFDDSPPYFYPDDLSPIDQAGVYTLYDQIRANSKPLFTKEQWDEVVVEDEQDG